MHRRAPRAHAYSRAEGWAGACGRALLRHPEAMCIFAVMGGATLLVVLVVSGAEDRAGEIVESTSKSMSESLSSLLGDESNGTAT